MKPASSIAAVLLIGMVFAASAPAKQVQDLSRLAHQALSSDAAVAEAAVARLRQAGPAGLEAILATHREEIAAAHSGPPSPQWARLASAIDAVAAQRDAHRSGLYWHTDIEQAKAAARTSGKAILSLRLLGKLTDEYSCANSRFFRTALYANAEVSRAMRENFVLHWQSVRPVPVVTIDMGDGRTIRRTITGNSIHYILDAKGRPVDALPGLYGPIAFLRGLDAARIIEAQLREAPAAERSSLLAQLHQAASANVAAAWANDLNRVGLGVREVQTLNSVATEEVAAEGEEAPFPTARAAAVLAVGKSALETRLVESIASGPDPAVMASSTTDEIWSLIAELHAEDAQLDDGSRALIRAKHPSAREAGVISRSKVAVEDPLVAIIQKFERSIAEDTVRNEYIFHRQIHDWFAQQAPESAAVDSLNERVYAELFLTPSADPWLGLVPADAYSALDGEGLIVSNARR